MNQQQETKKQKFNHEQKLPNILWICSDQQRFDTLGCYGNNFVHTPVLDKLAAEGALMEHAYSQSPVCTPSRTCFLTGRYPVTAKGRQNGADIPKTELVLPRILKDYGYTNGLSGKLHLSACNPQSGCTKMERRIDDGYDEFYWSHDTAAFWGTHNSYYKWLEEQGKTFSTKKSDESSYIEYGMPEPYHQTTWTAEMAIDFIKRHREISKEGETQADQNKTSRNQAYSSTSSMNNTSHTSPKNSSRPWMFSMNMYDPHHPFDPPKSYLEKYLGIIDEIPLPNYEEGEEKTKTIWQRIDHQGAYGGDAGDPYEELSDRDHKYIRAAYWAMCELIDNQVGRVVQVLEETGQRENTIIIFSSDHGEMLGDHGIYLKGPYFYEPAIHVPLIINWPGHIKAGRRMPFVELMDIPQTLFELLQIEPEYALQRMQGKSFAGLLLSDQEAHKENIYCEYYNAMPWHDDPKANATMLRTQNWKIVKAHHVNDGELYDLKHDPNEHRNLWNAPEHQTTKMTLLELLIDRMAQTVDPEPQRTAPW